MNRRRWIVLFLVFLGILVSYIDRGNLSIAAETLMRDLHLAPASMGLLLSAFFWTYGICQLPAGLLVDRFGVRRVYAAAFLIWSLASASIAVGRGPSDIIVSRLLLGLAESVAPLASLAFIHAYFAVRERGLPVAIYISGQTLGPALGALLGSTLLTHFGWRFLFAATGLGALLWIPGWLYYSPRGRPAVTDPSRAAFVWPWRAILTNPSFWSLSACVFFFSYYWYFLLTWMPAYLTIARGFSTSGMGHILSLPLFAMAGFNILAGWLADRAAARARSVFWVRICFALAGLLGASTILLLNFTSGHTAVLPILAISMCSFGAANSNLWTIAQNAAPPSAVGRSIGYLNTISQLAGASAPLLTGWSLGPLRDFHLAIWVAGCCPLVACVCLLIAGRGLDRLRLTLVTGQKPTCQN